MCSHVEEDKINNLGRVLPSGFFVNAIQIPTKRNSDFLTLLGYMYLMVLLFSVSFGLFTIFSPRQNHHYGSINMGLNGL